LPILPTPAHPSYPSNHATQAHCIAALLGQASSPAHRVYLTDMANRIAENRERAGVHFKTDSQGGKALGRALAGILAGIGPFPTLLAESKAALGHAP
jgi:hypothetical protein